MIASLVREIGSVQNECRRLKSEQTIPGSALMVATSTVYTDRITVAAGAAQSGAYGTISFRLNDVQTGSALGKIAMMNISTQAKMAEMSWDNPLNTSNRPGSNNFHPCVASLNDNGTGTINFTFYASYGILQDGFGLDMRVISSGAGTLQITNLEWHII